MTVVYHSERHQKPDEIWCVSPGIIPLDSHLLNRGIELMAARSDKD